MVLEKWDYFSAQRAASVSLKEETRSDHCFGSSENVRQQQHNEEEEKVRTFCSQFRGSGSHMENEKVHTSPSEKPKVYK